MRLPGIDAPIMATVMLAAAYCTAQPALGGPVPLGNSTTTISYQTGAGLAMFSGLRDYLGSGPTDATALLGADNIRIFNSESAFGRRAIVPGAVGPNETLISHAFYKNDNSGAYFPGMVAGSDIRLEFSGIQFDQPVTVDESTLMLHVLWNADQVDQLDGFYIHLSNHHTADAAFRDLDDFEGLVFFDLPSPNFVLGSAALQWEISGDGFGTPLSVAVTFPYDLLQSLEEDGQVVGPGLPAPHGFLEPFHFHIEYVVVPEPATLALLLVGGIGLLRRGRV